LATLGTLVTAGLDLVDASDRDIVEFRVSAGSQAAGRRLLDLGLPRGALVI
jgi:hypothetical protein